MSLAIATMYCTLFSHCSCAVNMGQNAMCPVWVYSLEGIGPSIGNAFCVRYVFEKHTP